MAHMLVWMAGMLSLLSLASAGGTETVERVDFIGTYLRENSKLLTRVEKTVNVNYYYSLAKSYHGWTQFNDMAIYFELEFAQYVSILYNIGT